MTTEFYQERRSVRGRYGCKWTNGLGTSANGEDCGECYPGRQSTCKKLKSIRDDAIRQMRNEGQTYAAIAKCFGLTKQRVHQIINYSASTFAKTVQTIIIVTRNDVNTNIKEVIQCLRS